MNKQRKHSVFSTWMMRHGQAFFASLGRFFHYPLANIMTIAVIGIALALPTGLYVLLQNVKQISHGFDNSAQISMFLKMNVSSDQAQLLLQKLQQDATIAKATYISPDEGLKQFETQSGFGNVLLQLHSNPLPAVILVKPAVSLQTPLAIHQLLMRLKQLPDVQSVGLDMEWIKRLYGIINLAERGVWVLALLLALGVILIVGNTIRLIIQNNRLEIEVTKLVGASNAFIRRPFLYSGILYGFFGAWVAFLCVELLLGLLSTPVENLTGLYQSSFVLRGFNLFSTELLFLIGIGLGLSGAWLAVGKQLRRIEPK